MSYSLPCVSVGMGIGVSVDVGFSYQLVGIFKTKPLTQLVSALCSLCMIGTISLQTLQIMGALLPKIVEQGNFIC